MKPHPHARRLPRFIFNSVLAAVSSAGVLTSRAGFQDYDTPEIKLGRDPVTAGTLGAPVGVAVDPVSHKIFVSDANNNRVLRFPAAAVSEPGTPAEAVFGQPDFFSRTSGTTAKTMQSPRALAVDNSGNLWVVDLFNRRVLRFSSASSSPSGAAADSVLGQQNMVTDTLFPTSASTFNGPSAIAIYGTTALFIADSQNNRILRFPLPEAYFNGASADRVFGQTDFVSGGPGLSAGRLNYPLGISLELAHASNMLWVADSQNNRVLGYPGPDAVPGALPLATRVLGQPNFLTNLPGTSSMAVIYPSSIAAFGGALYVGDTSNRRILRWDSPQAGANGKAASICLGQNSFTDNVSLGSGDYFSPAGLTVDAAGHLWVVDSPKNRVLRFDNARTRAGSLTHEGYLLDNGPGGFLPTALAIDPIGGNVYVAGNSGEGVRRFSSYESMRQGDWPEAVLVIGNPWGLACTASGTLWVVDSDKNRVLRFDNARNLPSGAPPSGVLGQPDFQSVGAGSGPAHLHFPIGIAVDPGSGTLWVGDYNNNRVLRFNAAHLKANGAAADAVLGQPNFSTVAAQTGDHGMTFPRSLCFDAGGRLWVGDAGNARVLRFDNALTTGSAPMANAVLGQADFGSVIKGNQAGRFGGDIHGLSMDAAGRLYVVDGGNKRIVWFNGARLKPNGAPADGLLGQPAFGTSGSNSDIRTFDLPTALVLDPGGALWVGDQNKNRLLRFPATTPKAASFGVDAQQHFFLNVATTPGGLYQWERSTELQSWTPYNAPFQAGGNMAALTDLTPAPARRFHRVREVAP